jgi:hypothetical protein
MFRLIAILAAGVLAAGAAYGQSSPQPQPSLPLGQGQTMGHMGGSMMHGEAESGMMSMMRMMRLMESGMMGPGMQSAETMGGDTGGTMCRGQMAMMRTMGVAGSPDSHLEARLAFTRSELAITAEQDTVWQAYAAAVRGQTSASSPHQSGKHHVTKGDDAFPAKLDARIEMLEDRLANLQAVRAPAVALYGTLDDGQKNKADALLTMTLCL